MTAQNKFAELAAPLNPSDISWRIDSKPKLFNGKNVARFVCYVEAGTVRERLDSVFSGEWDLMLEPLRETADSDGIPQQAFKARLSVCGTVREDVGIGPDYKQAATDAFKRAAVRFGIGHELYAMEVNWVEVDGDGKFAKPVEDPQAAYDRRYGGRSLLGKSQQDGNVLDMDRGNDRQGIRSASTRQGDTSSRTSGVVGSGEQHESSSGVRRDAQMRQSTVRQPGPPKDRNSEGEHAGHDLEGQSKAATKENTLHSRTSVHSTEHDAGEERLSEVPGVRERAATEAGGTGSLQEADGNVACPKCSGSMWDNRLTKRNPKAPDYKCRQRSCDGVIWPSRAGTGMDQESWTPQEEPQFTEDDLPF